MKKIFRFFFLAKPKKQPLWETDLREWARSAGTEAAIDEMVNTLPKGRIIDYKIQTWGKSFVPDERIGVYVRFGHGFYSGPDGPITAGDYVIINSEEKKRLTYLILHIEYCTNPKDMYFAYSILVDKEE